MSREPLANAELAVMELLWNKAPQTARAIQDALYPASNKAQHGTVQKLLQRLESKDYVRRNRDQAAHLFSPSLTREAYAAGQLESLTEKLTSGSLAPLITHLLQEKKISSSEIQRIRKALDLPRKKPSRRKS